MRPASIQGVSVRCPRVCRQSPKAALPELRGHLLGKSSTPAMPEVPPIVAGIRLVIGPSGRSRGNP